MNLAFYLFLYWRDTSFPNRAKSEYVNEYNVHLVPRSLFHFLILGLIWKVKNPGYEVTFDIISILFCFWKKMRFFGKYCFEKNEFKKEL